MSERRAFLKQSAAVAAAGAIGGPSLGSVEATPTFGPGKAEHCLFLWLGGGVAQMDTFDPKRRGDPKLNRPGSYYDLIPTAVPGLTVCEHLPRTARLMERMTVVRTLFHDTIDEHATAVHFVHTGRKFSETIRFPSIGSVIAHETPPPPNVPSYMVIGYPSTSREPG
ncbi:MAG: DUF1501 domain-containing protein, partial [Planctomycetia bacterium]